MDADDDADDVDGHRLDAALPQASGAAHNSHNVLENAAGDVSGEAAVQWRCVSHSTHRPNHYWCSGSAWSSYSA